MKYRIKKHNEGGSYHTSKYKPWKLIWYCAFQDKYKALEFEKYLKPHSGKAFASKFVSTNKNSTLLINYTPTTIIKF